MSASSPFTQVVFCRHKCTQRERCQLLLEAFPAQREFSVRLLVQEFRSITMPCLLLLRPPWHVGDAFSVRLFVAKALKGCERHAYLCTSVWHPGCCILPFYPFTYFALCLFIYAYLYLLFFQLRILAIVDPAPQHTSGAPQAVTGCPLRIVYCRALAENISLRSRVKLVPPSPHPEQLQLRPAPGHISTFRSVHTCLLFFQHLWPEGDVTSAAAAADAQSYCLGAAQGICPWILLQGVSVVPTLLQIFSPTLYLTGLESVFFFLSVFIFLLNPNFTPHWSHTSSLSKPPSCLGKSSISLSDTN